MRWAAAPVAVSRHRRDDGVEEAPGRRPGARRPYPAGYPLGAGFRRGKAPEGRPRGREAQRNQDSNDVRELELNLAAMTLILEPQQLALAQRYLETDYQISP